MAMRRNRLLFALFLFGPLAARAESAALPQQTNRSELVVAQWNVENLFDAEDDPRNEGDDEFTPAGWRRWSDKLYRIKLAHLAEAVARIQADVLCLQEIENRRTLDDLCLVLKQAYTTDYPYVVHREGQDHRGIDVAVLSRIEPARPAWLTPVDEQRDILVVRFDASGAPLTLLVNHWKSRWGSKAKAMAMRTEQARAARAEVGRILREEPSRAVMVVGDFNDDFSDPSVADVLGSATNLTEVASSGEGKLLFNLHATLPPAHAGTFYYRRGTAWNTFDSISVSRSMVPGDTAARPGWRIKPGSYEVFRPAMLADDEGRPLPFRLALNKDTGKREYIMGYSDHFPVRVVVELR